MKTYSQYFLLLFSLCFSFQVLGQKGILTDPKLPADAPKKIHLHEIEDLSAFKTAMQKSFEQKRIAEIPEEGYVMLLEGSYKPQHTHHIHRKVGFAVWFKNKSLFKVGLIKLPQETVALYYFDESTDTWYQENSKLIIMFKKGETITGGVPEVVAFSRMKLQALKSN